MIFCYVLSIWNGEDIISLIYSPFLDSKSWDWRLKTDPFLLENFWTFLPCGRKDFWPGVNIALFKDTIDYAN
jgi:hypothetical protein